MFILPRSSRSLFAGNDIVFKYFYFFSPSFESVGLKSKRDWPERWIPTVIHWIQWIFNRMRTKVKRQIVAFSISRIVYFKLSRIKTIVFSFLLMWVTDYFYERLRAYDYLWSNDWLLRENKVFNERCRRKCWKKCK